MGKRLYKGSILLLFFFCTLAAKAVELNAQLPLDSILNNVFRNTDFYYHVVRSYDAQLYIKSIMDIKKSNYLIHSLPYLYRTDKRKKYIMESINDIHYTAPDIYKRSLIGVQGTVKGFHGLHELAMDYFNINVYAPSYFNGKFYSPLYKKAKMYYKYSLDSVYESNGTVFYKISYTPKHPSYQLMAGWVVVESTDWAVVTCNFKAQNEYMKGSVTVQMGQDWLEKFLPANVFVDIDYHFIGNKEEVKYFAYLKYDDIKLFDNPKSLIKKKNKYDLSHAFYLMGDSKSIINDSITFSCLRPIPLSDDEQKMYKEFSHMKDAKPVKPVNKVYNFGGELGDKLLNSYSLDMRGLGNIRCSPIFNPLLLDYSHSDGVSYKQVFKYRMLMHDDKLLSITPRLGYNFKYRDLYVSFPIDLLYYPKKSAVLHLEVGNGNRIYNSRLMKEMNELPDSLYNFKKMHLDYFRDYYLDFNNSFELFNGFKIYTGIMIHRRVAMKNSLIVVRDSSEIIGLRDKFKPAYNSFAPRITIQWTPGQYYYMDGQRKVTLKSFYPTFTLDYERGLKRMFGSAGGQYERMEADMQYHLPINLMNDLYLRAGCGAFTNASQIYFVDFVNFTKNNLPSGWDDDIGGVFQLLNSGWYNSSSSYVRANLVYESPFLLLHLCQLTKTVMKERLYFNVLSIPRLTPYWEVGYGVGTDVFDFGAFVSFNKYSYKTFGCRVTIELFNK